MPAQHHSSVLGKAMGYLTLNASLGETRWFGDKGKLLLSCGGRPVEGYSQEHELWSQKYFRSQPCFFPAVISEPQFPRVECDTNDVNFSEGVVRTE